jgi:hypothetical protein
VHPFHRREPRQVVEDGPAGEVTDVKDERRLTQDLDTRSRQGPLAPREVRVSEERDQRMPSTKAPSR